MKQAPAQSRFAAMAVDVVVFGIVDEKLHVLIDTVDRPPHYTDIDAFIGGLIKKEETAEQAITRHLQTKGTLRNLYTEQLYTFSTLDRDRRNRVISIAYLGLVQPDVIQTYKHASARWVPVTELGKLAYDHNEIYQVALARLQGKLSYTTIVNKLLPTHFTLTELQNVYETILHRAFDKRNFRKKFLALDVIKETGRMEEGVKHRPAALYTFKTQELMELQLLV